MIEKTCKYCGKSLSDFFNTYYLGCPQCYDIFREEIKSTLSKTQGATTHNGKKVISGVDKALLLEYNSLIKQKELAGLEGRFKDMVVLTNEIIELSEELKKRGLI